MKYLIISLLILFSSVQALAQSNPAYFYYYKGEKKKLELNTEYAYLVTSSDVSGSGDLLSTMKGSMEITKFDQDKTTQTLNTSISNLPTDGATSDTWAEVRLSAGQSESGYLNYITQLKQNRSIKIAAPYFKNEAAEKIGLSQYFYVKLKSEHDLEVLEELAVSTNTQIVGHNKFMPLWVTLKCTETSSINSLEAANLFYESGNFAAAEPDFMIDDELHNTNDPLLGDQWGHNNTGQDGGTAGVDLDVFDAWDITMGNAGVVVAILDHGFEMNHPDLDGNTFGTGFDTESGTSPAQVLGSHGTACAGIVGAEADNNDGVAGVAPEASLMSISNSLAGTPNSRQRRADGINWAVQNGADVISNSWGSGVQYQIIDDAIDDAIAFGRGGLGTVVVFSSGNNNSATSNYPGNSDPMIINVGAIDRCGVRSGRIDVIPDVCDPWTGSSASAFGNTLDVVAPGTSVSTTDRQGASGYNINATSDPGDYTDRDYTNSFGGTSAACPYVAGVVALVLSANPNLTVQQVNDIIEQSATKVRPDLYTYANTAGRPNGTWNNELGYGLVNAHQAVLLAQDCEANITITQNVPSGSTDSRQASNSITANNTIFSGGTAAYSAGSSVTLNPGFHAQSGSSFRAFIQGCNATSSTVAIASTSQRTITYDQREITYQESEFLDNAVTLWPNPSKGNFNLKLGTTVDPINQVVILDNRGREVATFKNVVPNETFSIDVSENTGGIYIVKIVEKGNVLFRKMVIGTEK